MDQNTQILLAVFAGISLLLAISGAVFAWRAMNTASRRRFNPRAELIVPEWATAERQLKVIPDPPPP